MFGKFIDCWGFDGDKEFCVKWELNGYSERVLLGFLLWILLNWVDVMVCLECWLKVYGFDVFVWFFVNVCWFFFVYFLNFFCIWDVLS